MNVGLFSTDKFLVGRNLSLFIDLTEYFTLERTIEQLIPFMTEKKVSGRMCDYLLTTFSKKNYCPVGNYDIRHLYDLVLRESGGRTYFDPFNRISSGVEIFFSINSVKRTTTLAQMNFVRWYYFNGIHEFIQKNRSVIVADMRNAYRQKSSVGKKRKREGHGTVIMWKKITVYVNL